MKSGYDILYIIATFLSLMGFSFHCWAMMPFWFKFGLSFGLRYKNNPVYREIYRVIGTYLIQRLHCGDSFCIFTNCHLSLQIPTDKELLIICFHESPLIATYRHGQMS